MNKNLSVSSDAWQKFWMNVILEYGIPYASNKVYEKLFERYSIVNWRQILGTNNVVIEYTNERLITFFILRWS